MKNKFNIILLSSMLALITSCSTQSILISKGSENDLVFVEFADNPKKIETNNEYRFIVIDFSNSYSDILCEVNQGTIQQNLALGSPNAHFTFEPYKSGNLTFLFHGIVIDSGEQTNKTKIGSLEIEVK